MLHFQCLQTECLYYKSITCGPNCADFHSTFSESPSGIEIFLYSVVGLKWVKRLNCVNAWTCLEYFLYRVHQLRSNTISRNQCTLRTTFWLWHWCLLLKKRLNKIRCQIVGGGLHEYHGMMGLVFWIYVIFHIVHWAVFYLLKKLER